MKSQSLYKAEAGTMHFDENVETADTDNHDWNGWVAFIVVASTLLLNVITFSVIYKCCLKKKEKMSLLIMRDYRMVCRMLDKLKILAMILMMMMRIRRQRICLFIYQLHIFTVSFL